MSNEAVISVSQSSNEKRGKLSWVVPVFEAVMVIGYFLLAWNAVSEFISSFDIIGFFQSIVSAIYFLIVCTIISTIMCFIPKFKSRSNIYIAVGNIIWLGFNIYGLMGN